MRRFFTRSGHISGWTKLAQEALSPYSQLNAPWQRQLARYGLCSVTEVLQPSLSTNRVGFWRNFSSDGASDKGSGISHHHEVLIVGCGTGGLTVAAQLQREAQTQGNSLDIAIMEPSQVHYYQPGWTLVGAGVFDKKTTGRQVQSLLPPNVTLIPQRVQSFTPDKSLVTTTTGGEYTYNYLVVAAGLQINWGAIPGLEAALETPHVGSVYSYNLADKVWNMAKQYGGKHAIFTQPATPVKCGGAPQKVMWMAEDLWRVQGVRDATSVTFATGTPTMFAAPKYAKILQGMAEKRGVDVLLGHDLVEVNSQAQEAVFQKVGTEDRVQLPYDFLHVTPRMGPPDFIKSSPLANPTSGWVDVDKSTLQHVRYPHVFAIGDCSSLPTSKTAAAISAQAPVLVHNLLSVMEGRKPTAEYDGYTSCPLLLGYWSLMLAEFKYGGEPKETFGRWYDQGRPNSLFYRLKRDFFPWVYWRDMVKGKWFGANAWTKPTFPKGDLVGQETHAR